MKLWAGLSERRPPPATRSKSSHKRQFRGQTPNSCTSEFGVCPRNVLFGAISQNSLVDIHDLRHHSPHVEIRFNPRASITDDRQSPLVIACQRFYGVRQSRWITRWDENTLGWAGNDFWRASPGGRNNWNPHRHCFEKYNPERLFP